MLATDRPRHVEIVEVAPRDGLQNERRLLTAEQKLTLIESACDAGARRIEVTSFVRPDRVPQLADAEAVVAGLVAHPGVSYSALVLNERGYERALAAGIRELNTVVSASETFGQRNQGLSIAESVALAHRLAERSRADGVALTITVSVAFGCPFEGEIEEARLASVVDRVAATGVTELALADTIGVAVPTEIEARFGLLAERAPAVRRRVHLHNTRSTGIANAVAAVRSGVLVVDASLAGVGGCPFAPAATGNIATEDLVYTLERMGIETGLDLDRLIAAARALAAALGVEPPGLVSRAGTFPGDLGRR